DAARARFVAARLLLRRSASTVVGCAPDDVRVEVDDAGRPFVVGSPTPLYVSIAHSGDYVVVAVASRRVGVDIERLPATPLHVGIAKRICSMTELRDIARLDPSLRERAVMRLWTRKEAYGKAIGVGLGFPVRTITAGPRGSRITAADPTLPATRWGPGDRWRVVDVPVDPAYAAALVADGRRWRAHTHAVGSADL
ncbi:MAG: 4-phosphopantetheinyl transferase, partial [Actinomycetota bacterium]|nr:4-phosphopantetheinyl transferase [Actinomycetota bacterium]